MALKMSRSAVSARPQRAQRVVCSAVNGADKLKLAAATIAMTAGLLAGPVQAAGVSFSNLSSSASASSPVHVEMAVDGMTVKPASEGVAANTGHFHIIVDGKAPAEGEAIPFDDVHLHYGKGQTAADVTLQPGRHTLTLQFANALHLSYGPKYAQTVTVDVN